VIVDASVVIDAVTDAGPRGRAARQALADHPPLNLSSPQAISSSRSCQVSWRLRTSPTIRCSWLR
jgi:hypothetical protein